MLHIEMKLFSDSFKMMVPSVKRDAVTSIEEWLTFLHEKTIKLPDEFIFQVLNYHGGIPGKQCFNEPDGNARMVRRFCNILRREDLKPSREPSWGADLTHDMNTVSNYWRMPTPIVAGSTNVVVI